MFIKMLPIICVLIAVVIATLGALNSLNGFPKKDFARSAKGNIQLGAALVILAVCRVGFTASLSILDIVWNCLILVLALWNFVQAYNLEKLEQLYKGKKADEGSEA